MRKKSDLASWVLRSQTITPSKSHLQLGSVMRAKVISVVFLSLSFMIASITGCSGKTPAISTVSKQVHKMKGSAANVGGEALRDAAWEVEQAGKAGDMARVARWVSELETQVVRLNEALQQWES